jgi:transcriptional regulator of arginine metabolism
MSAARHRAITSLINRRVITSQAQLIRLLAEQDFQVTQATISRDLKAIGASKQRDAKGRLRYAIPPGRAHGEEEVTLGRALEAYAQSIAPTGSLVVLRTPPGAAHIVAAAIDAMPLRGVLGTVAGDDTLLVVTEEQVGGWRIAKELERIGAAR